MSFTTPAWPTTAVYVVCTILGGTAVGWNGVFIAEIRDSEGNRIALRSACGERP